MTFRCEAYPITAVASELGLPQLLTTATPSASCLVFDATALWRFFAFAAAGADELTGVDEQGVDLASSNWSISTMATPISGVGNSYASPHSNAVFLCHV